MEVAAARALSPSPTMSTRLGVPTTVRRAARTRSVPASAPTAPPNSAPAGRCTGSTVEAASISSPTTAVVTPAALSSLRPRLRSSAATRRSYKSIR